jgi:hypothetical protein
VAGGFIVDQMETKYQAIQSATSWLQDKKGLGVGILDF